MSVPASIFLQTPLSGMVLQQAATNLWTRPKAIVSNHIDYLSAVLSVFPALTATLARSTSIYHTPPSALQITAAGGNPVGIRCTSIPFTFQANITYAVSAWMNCDASYGAANMLVEGVVPLSAVNYNAALGGWQRVSLIIRLGATAAKTLRMLDTGIVQPNASAIAYVDDIQIEVGGAPTEYIDGSLGSPAYSWLGAPGAPGVVVNPGAGSIAAGTYLIAATALQTLPDGSTGEGLASALVTATVTSASSITITPATFGPATSFNIYIRKSTDSAFSKSNTVGAETLTTYTAGSANAPVAWNCVSQRGTTASTGQVTQVIYGDLTILGKLHGVNIPFLNAIDFGATLNGIDDDTVALQNLFNAAAAQGKLAYIPGGTAVITNQLTAACWIMGDSPAATTIRYNGSGVAHGLKFYLTQVGGIDAPQNTGSVAGMASSVLVLTGTRANAGIMNLTLTGSIVAPTGGRLDYPAGLMCVGNPWVQNVQCNNFDTGLILHSTGGHWTLNNVTCNANWYGIYFIQDFGDGIVFECDLTTNLFASAAWHSVCLGSALWWRTHIGSGAYCWYEEFNSINMAIDTLAHVQAAMAACTPTWFQSVRTDSCHFEAYFAAAIYSEPAALDLYGGNPLLNGVLAATYTATPSQTTPGAISWCDWPDLGGSWQKGNSMGRPADYAVVVGPMAYLHYHGGLPTMPLGSIWTPFLAKGSTLETFDVRNTDTISIGNAANRASAAGSITKRPWDESVARGTGTIANGTNAVSVVIPSTDLSGVVTNLGTPGVPIAIGGIGSIGVLTGGSGYASGATVAFSGGVGSGAAATATVTGGVVTSITITSAGNYTVLPTVTINPVGGGSGATAEANFAPTGTINASSAGQATMLPVVTATSSAGNMTVPVMLVVSAPAVTLNTFNGNTPNSLAVRTSAQTSFTVTLINPSTGAAVNAVSSITFNWRIL